MAEILEETASFFFPLLITFDALMEQDENVLVLIQDGWLSLFGPPLQASLSLLTRM